MQRAIGNKVPQFRDALTEYALSLKASRAVSSPDFTVTPAMRDELFNRMTGHGIKVGAPPSTAPAASWTGC